MAISSTSANEPRGLVPAAVHTHRCVLLASCLRHGNGGHEVECEWGRKAAHQEGCRQPARRAPYRIGLGPPASSSTGHALNFTAVACSSL